MIKAFELKKKGYYKQAIEIFYKLLAKENDNIEILSELGCIYLLLNNYDRAIHYTGKALDIDSSHINSLKTLREIYTKQKKFNEAGRIANKIYIISNSQADLYQFLKLLNIQQKYNEVTGFADFIQSENVAGEIAFAYYKLQKFEDAINTLKPFTDNNNNPKLQDLLCKIYFETKQTDKEAEGR